MWDAVMDKEEKLMPHVDMEANLGIQLSATLNPNPHGWVIKRSHFFKRKISA
jgi:hypothetical protein